MRIGFLVQSRFFDRWFYFFQQTCQIAHLNTVAGALDSTASRVAEHNDKFRSGYLAGIFHTPDDVIINNIARNADAENITETLVEDEFDRRSAVHAAQRNSERILLMLRVI